MLLCVCVLCVLVSSTAGWRPDGVVQGRRGISEAIWINCNPIAANRGGLGVGIVFASHQEVELERRGNYDRHWRLQRLC
jgi:hypothetical protein